jgi:probable F420-dependent oxidoreductase
VKVDGGLRFAATGIAEAARRGEAVGYDGLWSAETAHDPFVVLAQAAAVTERVELGTSIAVAFARNPMTLAVVANDLQTLSGGRFALGLGSQVRAHITRRYSMPWSHPAPRMRELVLAVRAIWAAWSTPGATLDFSGDYYTHTLMTPFFDPGPNPFGPPRIVLAAVGPRMTEVAGEVADGLLVHSFTTERYLREVTRPALAVGAERAGRDPGAVEVGVPAFVVTGRDEQEMAAAAAEVRRQIAFYASTPAYRPVLDLHGWGDLHPEAHRLSRQGAWEAMGHLVDDEMLNTFAVIGRLEDVPRLVEERFGGLADRFSFSRPALVDDDRWREILAQFHH